MVDWYAPGFKAGGPIRSAVNFADHLENDLEIFVLTTDRDLGDIQAYPGILVDQWIQKNDHQVFYASPAYLNWASVKKIAMDIAPDFIYLNSIFSRYFTIYPLLMKRMGFISSKLVLAPRGMLRESALAHKSGKKKIFIGLLKRFGLTRELIFHATDNTEEKDVKKVFGNDAALFRAGNLPGKQKSLISISDKVPGYLKIVFVGRIHPIKNLDLLLRALQNVNGKVELTVIAPLEDQSYWHDCQQLIAKLPEGIVVSLLENVPHEKIEEIILSNHIFAHAIFEALAAGRPVLISDQTPWRNLEINQAGWDLSLHDESSFSAVINRMVAMDMNEINIWCSGAWELARQYADKSETKRSILSIFNTHITD
jgi:glycosyltransferase involved in cell wall biosynthesis